MAFVTEYEIILSIINIIDEFSYQVVTGHATYL